MLAVMLALSEAATIALAVLGTLVAIALLMFIMGRR
jgi:hypothetical protein